MTEDKLDAILELRAIFSKIGFTLKELNTILIEETLNRNQGNRTRSAIDLGIAIRTIRNKVAGRSTYVKKAKKTSDL